MISIAIFSERLSTRQRTTFSALASVHEVGRQGLSDREQLEYAAAEKHCLVTRNRDDYLILTRELFDRSEPHEGVLVVSTRLAPDNFGRIAAAVKEYVDLYGEGPAAFLFDFVSDPERPA